jgi:murein DD-endopeptidase MepM/ murein hydrolase activator NlpD
VCRVWYKRSVRSHLVRGGAALALAILVGVLVPIGRDRSTPVPAAVALPVDEARAAPADAAQGAQQAAAGIDASGPGQDRSVALPPARIAPLVSQLTGYVWPISNGRITQPFGFSPLGTLMVAGRLFHDGLDIATFCGDRIRAAHDGVVLAAGRRSDPELGWLGSLDAYHRRLDKKQLWGGLAIIVVTDDGNGYRSIYAHLSRTIVRAGQTIRAGQLIGYEGATGFASGCHLHFGLFSPLESATMELDPKIARKTHLPSFEIARIDPLLVLPARVAPPQAPSSGPTGPVSSSRGRAARSAGA